jgi:prepilin-type N-terminal cleavage/methylation domain-containing protein
MPQASSLKQKYSVNKAFTLAETLIVLAVMGLLVTFTVPKVIHEVGEQQKKAVGKETITALHDALYAGWQEGTLNSSTTLTQFGDYLATKLNVIRDCPAGRPAGDCVTSHTDTFGNARRILVLPNGAWVSIYGVYGVNPSALLGFHFFVDYNGATGPNTEPNVRGTATTSDIICLWFNPSNQKVTINPSRHGDNYQAGSLVADRHANRHLVYNYWMGLD